MCCARLRLLAPGDDAADGVAGSGMLVLFVSGSSAGRFSGLAAAAFVRAVVGWNFAAALLCDHRAALAGAVVARSPGGYVSSASIERLRYGLTMLSGSLLAIVPSHSPVARGC